MDCWFWNERSSHTLCKRMLLLFFKIYYVESRLWSCVFPCCYKQKLPSTALSVSTHCNWQLVMTIHDDDDVWWQWIKQKLLKICRWRFLQPCKNRTNHVCAFHSDKIFYEQLYYIQTFGTQVLRNIIYKIHSLVFKKYYLSC